MAYVIVSDIGLIDTMTNDINVAVNRIRELKNDYNIDAEILDKIEDIEDVMFNTDGLNDSWIEDYYCYFPHDAGIDIKIPIGLLDTYFGKAIDVLADIECASMYEMCDEQGQDLSYDEINDRVDEFLERTLGCSNYILDKILHGEYKVVG